MQEKDSFSIGQLVLNYSTPLNSNGRMTKAAWARFAYQVLGLVSLGDHVKVTFSESRSTNVLRSP